MENFMNIKIIDYVNNLFVNCEDTEKTKDLKDEILSNLFDHYNEALESGLSKEDAYKKAISKLGNIDNLIAPLKSKKSSTKKLLEILSVLLVPIYFIISFITGAWNITWIIFLLIPCITKIYNIINS